MARTDRTPPAPGWRVLLLLPLIHFASVKLTFFCAVTPDNEVVVWLPNAVLLAALLRFHGQRALLMAALTLSSDILANLPVFPWLQAVLLSACNLAEVGVTYFLMRRSHASPSLRRLRDFAKFLLAGPVIGALLASFCAASVLKFLGGADTAYLTLTRLWWFGDGLGQLIYTPLLLAFARPAHQLKQLRALDYLTLAATGVLALLVLTARGGAVGGVSVTPTLLLPPVAAIAFRFGTRWTAAAVALISLATAMLMTTGHQPFGDVPVHLETVRAQEFILTLCMVGFGFAVLFSELQLRERDLESRVRQRTRELEVSNAKLETLSSTDSLTGIANRRRFDEVLQGEWNRARRNHQPLALAMLDVDLFKQYNDYYGHQAGDERLRTVARELSAHVRRNGDYVARYGGEEFVFIWPATDQRHALPLAEDVCAALEALAMPHEKSPFKVLTASIGVAVMTPREHDSVEILLKMADEALYRAKQLGRNQVMMAESATIDAV
jgi:diguanylate cyclase (GGDEF)-like protein